MLFGVKVLSYCAKCGAKFQKEDKFCSSCGSKVDKITSEEYSVDSDNLIERVKELLHEGNVTRIIVKNEKGQPLIRASNEILEEFKINQIQVSISHDEDYAVASIIIL